MPPPIASEQSVDPLTELLGQASGGRLLALHTDLARSPAVLAAYLGLRRAGSDYGTLAPMVRAAIMLAVGVADDGAYSQAIATQLAIGAGMTPEQTVAVRTPLRPHRARRPTGPAGTQRREQPMSAPTLLPRPDWLPRERWPFLTGALATAVGQIAVTDVGEGPTLLFVHVGSWSFVWRDLLLALSPHHRCVALDAPGSGLSSHPDSVVGLEAAALAVSAVIDELDLRETTLVMHDVGGPVGLAAAARQPNRIAGLVALNALGWRPTGTALRGMLAVMGSAPIRESAALLGWAARLSASAFGAGREWTDEDRAVFLTGMDRLSRRNTHRYLRALRTENDLLQRAEAALRGPLSRLPLLTVFGSRNDPFKLGPKWKQLFPDAEQHTIPGGNQYPMGDDPAGVSTLIRLWHSAHVHGAHQPQRSGSLPAQKSR